MLEAVSSGASASVVIVANIAVNLIAFIAILEFINATLRWLGSMVSYPELTFQVRPAKFPVPRHKINLQGKTSLPIERLSVPLLKLVVVVTVMTERLRAHCSGSSESSKSPVTSCVSLLLTCNSVL